MKKLAKPARQARHTIIGSVANVFAQEAMARKAAKNWEKYLRTETEEVKAARELKEKKMRMLKFHPSNAGGALFKLHFLIKMIEEQDPLLTSLQLSYHGLGCDGIVCLVDPLKQNDSIPQLNLNNNRLGDIGLARLLEGLRENTGIHELGLANNGITGASMFAIGEWLRTNKTLRDLNLRGNRIDEYGALRLLDAIHDNFSIVRLDLRMNNVSLKLQKKIQEILDRNIALPGFQSLEAGSTSQLTMFDCTSSNPNYSTGQRLADCGATALANALVHNNTVKTLRLWSNHVGEAGGVQLAHMFRTNRSLTSVSLQDNQLGDAAAIALGDSFEHHNRVLRTVRLFKNNISDRGASALASCLTRNAILTVLDLGSNKIKEAGAEALLAGLRKNVTLKQLGLVKADREQCVEEAPRELDSDEDYDSEEDAKKPPPERVFGAVCEQLSLNQLRLDNRVAAPPASNGSVVCDVNLSFLSFDEDYLIGLLQRVWMDPKVTTLDLSNCANREGGGSTGRYHAEKAVSNPPTKSRKQSASNLPRLPERYGARRDSTSGKGVIEKKKKTRQGEENGEGTTHNNQGEREEGEGKEQVDAQPRNPPPASMLPLVTGAAEQLAAVVDQDRAPREAIMTLIEYLEYRKPKAHTALGSKVRSIFVGAL
jgi:Ran GTPase-activating protein (RanGAP) involved in mRNA processing and transport